MIGLSLKTTGIGAYLDVQAFTGAMYIASFISSMSPLFFLPKHSILMMSTVWLLRSWKLQQLELLGLDDKQQAGAVQASGTAVEDPVPTRRSGRLRAYLRGMTVIKRV